MLPAGAKALGEDTIIQHRRLVARELDAAHLSRTGIATLRHSTAMELLHHGVDQSVIALWLGHESVETTQIYIHADMRLKEKALAQVASPETQPGRYRPNDELLALLESL